VKTSERRSREARLLLLTALGILVLCHFFPTWSFNDEKIGEIWEEVASDAKRFVHGRFSPDALMATASILTVAVVMMAAPFATGFLQRARALLWVMRLLALAFSGWFSWMIHHAARLNFSSTPMGWQEQMENIGTGMWLLILSLWLATAGLFWIPKRQEEEPSGPILPSTAEGEGAVK